MQECLSKNEQRASRKAMRGALDSTKSIHSETTKNHNIPYIKRRRLHTVCFEFLTGESVLLALPEVCGNESKSWALFSEGYYAIELSHANVLHLFNGPQNLREEIM